MSIPVPQQLLQSMLEQSPDMVVVLDPDATFVWCNAATGEFLGTTPEALKGRALQEFMLRQDHDTCGGPFRIPLEESEGNAREWECRLVNHEGAVRNIHWSAVEHRGADGRVQYTCQAKDVTEEHQAAVQLAQSEARLRAVLRGLLDGVVVVGLDGIIRDASPSMEAIYGWRPEELIGKNVNVLIPEPHHSLHDGYLDAYRRTGETWILGNLREFRVRHRSGHMFDLELAVSRVDVGATGESLLCGVLRDATARKEAERRVAESERRFRAVFEQEYQLVLLLDQEGRIIEANHAAGDLAGEAYGPLRGRPLWEAPWWARAADHNARIQSWLRSARDGGFVRSELELMAADGDLRVFDFSLKAVEAEQGAAPMFLVELRDMTEARRAQRREASMLRALAAIGESASILAHEIKNPITSINLALRSMATALGEDERLALDDLLARLRKLERTMRRTLSFARPLELNRCAAPAERVLREALEQLRPEAEERRIQLSCQVAGDLPDLLADEGHLEEALVNLVRNALDAVSDGGQVRATAELDEDGDVVLSIEDDGPGVPESIRGNLFDPFITTKAEGTGVGLALTRKVVEDHGGWIEVAEGDLGGACFRMGLPAAQGRAAAQDLDGDRSSPTPRGVAPRA